MLEFKKEYFQTETNRHLYPTTFDLSKAEVYGCKDREAYMYKIPNDRYTSNAGNIDFSLYPNGVWSDYTGIKIVERLPFFQPSINFNKLGDITPSNLNKLKEEIKKHIVDLETAITESVNFIDSGVPGQNNLPYLPEGCVWFRDPIIKDVIALPISELYGKFNQMIDELRKVLLKLLDKDYNDTLLKFLENVKKELERQLSILAGAGSAFKPKQVANIEILKNVNAKVDEVYEVLGYYRFDDGATHKRVITNEDDGSGVQLKNGMWANIVHNGEVNVSWFGAKGDGVTDDTSIFKKAISYAETNEYKLAFLKRKYYITDLITFYGNYDFNGATIKVIQGNKNTSFLGFYGSNFEISDTELTLEEINLGNFSKLKPYGKCKVYINSEDIFLEKRDHPLGSAVYKTDYILANNGVGEYQIFNDYTNITRIDLTKVDSRQKYIKNLNLEITLNNKVTDNYFAPVVKFWRYDNTLVDNIKINITNNDVQNKPTSIFDVVDTYNIEFNRINSETLLTTKQGTYVFNISRTIKLTIANSYIYNKDGKEYWGATGTNLLKDFTIKNSTINRMDSHTFGGGSYRIENSDVKVVSIMGDMDLIIENSIIGYVSFRKDYNNFFTGDINVKNTTFKDSQIFCVYHSSFFGDTSLFFCKKIYLENVNFLSNAFILSFDNVQKIFIPDIEINSMEIHGGNFAFIFAQKSINLKMMNDVVIFKLANQKNIELNYTFKIINTIEDGYNNIFNQNFLLRLEYENLKKINLRTERIKNIHLHVKNSEIISIDTLENSKTSNTSLILSNCIINPIGLEDASRDSSYQLLGVKYLLFDHCKFEIPQNITPDKAPTSHRLSFLNSTMIECPTEYINCEYTQTTLDYLESKKSDSKYSNMIAKFLTGTNALPKYGLRYFSKKIKDSIEGQVNAVEQLNTLYHMEKMKQEGVYNDYISYMDEKTVYDKQQRKLEQDKQLAYEQAMKENPNLTYEEFMSVQPMTLNLVEEPQPSEALKKFMEKYL